MRIKAPGGGKTGLHEGQIEITARFYPEKFIRGRFDIPTATTIDWIRDEQGSGVANSKLVFEFADKALMQTIENDWTLDFGKTTIDLETHVGGVLDGQSLETDRYYLVWGFLDEALNFAGLGITKKPVTSFSAGTGNKGTAATFTVTTAFQFTIGARICIRNDVGSQPQFEWNWGTITAIPSGAQLTIQLDNNPDYGFNITGVTNGIIIQWDKFRPFRVTPAKETLVHPFYSLIGEVYRAPSGNIERGYRKDEEKKIIGNGAATIINDPATQATFSLISVGRFIPLWAIDSVMLLAVGSTGDANLSIAIRTFNDQIHTRLFASTVSTQLQESVNYSLFPNASLEWQGDNTLPKFIAVREYSVAGGMVT